jgi:hypothetical protein
MMRFLVTLALCALAFGQTAVRDFSFGNDLDASYTWDVNFANRTVWYSAAAYCDKDTYLTRTWVGLTAGFTATVMLYDKWTDTNGYIGYNTISQEIYIVYRGSDSVRNWITNLKFAKADYAYPGCADCNVHKGFYDAEQAVWPTVFTEVKRLKILYPSYKVVATGHSLGAAIATLTALDLVNNGYPTIVYNIGCPRIGDDNFAAYAASKITDIHRIVHDDDMVPHVPYEWMGFHHVAREFFEQSNGVIRPCDSTGEDESCSMQYRFGQTSVDSHSWYLKNYLDCTTVSTPHEAAEHLKYLARTQPKIAASEPTDAELYALPMLH